jgi:pyruvate/2-oxoglutarate/acetoin dehydrogenase E1 component
VAVLGQDVGRKCGVYKATMGSRHHLREKSR